jgi:hypothetical protein
LVRPDPEATWERLASPRTSLVLGVLTLLLAIAAVPLTVLSAANTSGLVVVPFAIVGALVAHRQPRNPIGWILLALSIAFLVSSDGGQYAVMAYHQGYRGLPAPRVAAFLAALWIWLIMLLPLPLMLFPDGRLSQRWRWVLRVYLAVCALLVVGATWRDATGILAGHIRVDSSGELVAIGNSAGAGPIVALFAVVYVGFCLASVLRQLVSYRGSTGEHRQQLKWLLSGGAISVLGLSLTLAFSNAHSPVLRYIGSHSFTGLIALPIGLGVGISQVPAVRDRPADQPHALLRARVRAAGRRLRRVRDAHHGGAAVLLAGRRCRVHAGRRGPLQPVAASRSAPRRQALQPRPLRRRDDGCRFQRATAGRGRPRHGAQRAAAHRGARGRAGGHLALDPIADALTGREPRVLSIRATRACNICNEAVGYVPGVRQADRGAVR